MAKKLFLAAFIALAMIVTGYGSQEKKVSAEISQPPERQTQEVKITPAFKVGNETIELDEKKLLNGRITMLVPEKFEQMPEYIAMVKYPSVNRPEFILTNKETTINIALNHTENEISDAQMGELTDAMVQMLKVAYPSAQWLDKEVKTIKNKSIGVIEFISQAIDTKIYNKMLFAELDGRLLIITFNCTEPQIKDWKPIAATMLDSIKIK